jgi:hypothetical protein
MATQPQAPAVPPIEAVLGEVVATLAFAAHAYLSPPGEEQVPDLVAAEVAIDVAGIAFARVEPRLTPEERSQIAALLTDLRMTYVKKRGL